MEHFHLWFFIIAISYILILFNYIYFSYKPDLLNNIFGFSTISFVFAHILLFISLMNQEVKLQEVIIPVWLLSIGLPLVILAILILISTGLRHSFKKVFRKDLSKLVLRMEKKQEAWSDAKKDTLRKLNHIIIFIGLLIVWNIGLIVVKSFTGTSAGMIPEENNMLLLYLKLVIESNSIAEVLFSLGWFNYLLFFFFYTFCLFMLVNEFTRKSRFLSFPFNIFPKLYLSKEEKQSYGTYLYFAIGHMFAAFVCPPMVFFSILGMSSISDLITSQIGIRYGKTQISWNRRKTWEGTIAGSIGSFIICFFFVGVYWSFIFAIVFLIIDVLTSKPINICDNLLNPIGCSLIYLFVRFFFNFNYASIILEWL